MAREGALWIGGLEPYMDETFLRQALHKMGEDGIISIKVLRAKNNSESNYGFLNFDNDYSALLAMHKLNNKIIPNSSPAARFKLNHHSTRYIPGAREHSIWVGDLTIDVDDYQFYKFFGARFQSVLSAKVVCDQSGQSKGYGFVRFGNEQEQQTALATMNNAVGLGCKPIRVSSALPKKHGEYDSSYTDYSQYWQSYSQYWNQTPATAAYPAQPYYDASAYYGSKDGYTSNIPLTSSEDPANLSSKEFIDNGQDLHGMDHSDHPDKDDYDFVNRKFIENSEELWEAVHDSCWSTCDDSFQFE